MESRTHFFRELEEVKNKIEIVRNILNKDENEIIKNFIIISDNCSYLNNCLNSYREARNVLDPHLTLLVHAFHDFLKKSLSILNDICHFFSKLNDKAGHTELCENAEKDEPKKKQEMNEWRYEGKNKKLEKEGEYGDGNKQKEEKKQEEEDGEEADEDKDKDKDRNGEEEKVKAAKIKMYNVLEEIYKYYYTLISVRGEKKIKTHFSSDIFSLSKIVEMLLLIKKEEKVFDYLSTLKNEEYDENNLWLIIYVLLIWLSFCLYVPFPLTNVNKDTLSNIEEIYYYFLKRNEKSKEACSILFAQFFYRQDVFEKQNYFHQFLLFSKEVLLKLVNIEEEKKGTIKGNIAGDGERERDSSLKVIRNKDLPDYCNVEFSYLILHGVLLTHKKILKKLDKKLLMKYTNFYNFFFIKNSNNLDNTQTAKALKIRCLSYYSLLFLEKADVSENSQPEKKKEEWEKTEEEKEREYNKYENKYVVEEKRKTMQEHNIMNSTKKKKEMNNVSYSVEKKGQNVFDEFPLFLNINEVFQLYRKSVRGEKEYSSLKPIETSEIKIKKKYKCEKDILNILDILYFYFNDHSSYVRWCLSKSFGNILIYLSLKNVNYVFEKFEKLLIYNDDNIICTINYSLFHFIFNKNTITIDVLNYLLKKIIQSVYINKEKTYQSTFVLIYSFLKYNTQIKYYFEQNNQHIPFFLFHLIFIRLIVLSLFEDSINIRKSAISLLQFFIGKFNFLYKFKSEKEERDQRCAETYEGIDNQSQLFSNVLKFMHLFANHTRIANYYAKVKKTGDFLIEEKDTSEYKGKCEENNNGSNNYVENSNDISTETKKILENNEKQMREIKKHIFNVNIDLLSICNFSELINLKKSIILQTKKVCNCFLYKYPVIYHLYSEKLFHENINIRILSAESLANLATTNSTYFIYVVLPFLIHKSYEENVSTKHGSILCISKILLKLKKEIDEKLQNDIKQIIVYSEKKRIYKFKKGEILRHSICLLIQAICQCIYFKVKANTASFFLNILNANLFHYNEIIQYEAAKIFYYVPLYILSKEEAIHFVFDVIFKLVQERSNFLRIKGYFILLCFINECIIPSVAPKCIELFYYVLKKNSSHYKLKKKALLLYCRNRKKNDNVTKEVKTNVKEEAMVKGESDLKQINFESHCIDSTMKSFALLALFNVINKLRKIYITETLKLYEEYTTSFESFIISKNPEAFNFYEDKKENENGENDCDKKKNVSKTPSERERKRRMRNTSFYIDKKKVLMKKKKTWKEVMEKGKEKGINVLNFELNINKIIKIVILYLQEYIFEQDIGDSHIYVRELCLDLTTYLLSAFPIYFFEKGRTPEDTLQKKSQIPFSLEKKKKKITKLSNTGTIDPNFFHEMFSSDDSQEEDEEEEEEEEEYVNNKEKENMETKRGNGEETEYTNHEKENLQTSGISVEQITVYVLFEIQKRNINMLMQLLLKLLCEKNIRTHKKCLFLLNYLFNYAHFNSKKEKDYFHFENIFNKHCHDFSYELFLKKKIDDNIKKSKKNIFQYLSTYSTDIINVFNDVVIHTCDYYEPLYLKNKTNVNVSEYLHLKYYKKEKKEKRKDEEEEKKGVDKNGYEDEGTNEINSCGNNCQCFYVEDVEEITELFLNRNYKYDIMKTIFNKINNFIYLYNYALKYTSFSVFHKNKFISTRKALIRRNENNAKTNIITEKENSVENKGGAENVENRMKEKKKQVVQKQDQNELKFDTIIIDNDFIDEINLSENEEENSMAEEEMIKDVHFLLDKTKKNISVIKYLEYNETHLYNHIFYLLFFNKYNYFIISGFFSTLSYYSSTNEYSSYAYTNLIKKEKELSVEFQFLEFIQKYNDVYTYGYIRDDILFLYIRYYTKFFLNYDYSVVDTILQIEKEKNVDVEVEVEVKKETKLEVEIELEAEVNVEIKEKEPKKLREVEKDELSLHDYHLNDINLKEVLTLEKQFNKFNYLKNIFYNYNIHFENNVMMSSGAHEEANAKEKKKKKKQRRKQNKEVKKLYQDKIALLPYVNICLIKILYYLNNFNLIQLELFLKSVNSFIKFSIINDFSAFCFLNFFHFFLKKYDCFKLIKIMSELIINIYMCPPINPNIKKFALFLILNLLMHKYPKIREYTVEHFYANLNFVSSQEVTNYLFRCYDDLENMLNILISVQFSSPLQKKSCPIKKAIHEMATIMNIPFFNYTV